MENKNQSKIREIVSAWIEHAQIQQKDLSSEINVTPASLNKFLKADGVFSSLQLGFESPWGCHFFALIINRLL